MVGLKPGQLVRSLAGRDKDKHYLVLSEFDSKHVLLIDGRSRTIDRPKKKNIAHIQRYERRADFDKLLESGQLTDSQVINYLRKLVPVTGTPIEEV